jgi:hypothetical protein
MKCSLSIFEQNDLWRLVFHFEGGGYFLRKFSESNEVQKEGNDYIVRKRPGALDFSLGHETDWTPSAVFENHHRLLVRQVQCVLKVFGILYEMPVHEQCFDVDGKCRYDKSRNQQLLNGVIKNVSLVKGNQ